MKIKEKTEEPLLSRTKLTIEIDFDGATISRKDLAKKISQSLKADESLITVKKINTIFGHKKGNAIVYVYKNIDEMKKIEPKIKEKKAKEEKK